MEQKDSAFVQFETMAYGYRAAWKALESYWKHFHTTQRERHEKLHPHRAPALRLGWQGEPAAAIARGGGSLVADCFQKKRTLAVGNSVGFLIFVENPEGGLKL